MLLRQLYNEPQIRLELNILACNSEVKKVSTLDSGVLRLCNNTILTYLLTPWCRVLLEKPTGLQLVKKFPAFHGTRMFITALTSVRHLSLSWANPIQSTYPHPTSWRSILILSTHLRLGQHDTLEWLMNSSSPHPPRNK